MSKQANNNVIDFGALVRAANAYATASETIERAQQNKQENKKILADFIRAHAGKWTSDLNKKVKKAIEDMPPGICSDKVGLLGVLKTCCEYGILPTTVNANRLRKIHKTWTTIDGKTIPNGYKNKHKEKATAPASEEKGDADIKSLINKIDGMLAPATTAPATTAPATTAPKTSSKATTAQKAEDKVHPLTSNVSSSDAPIPPREHFKTLMVHLFKNETFRSEYCDILALMLDVDKSTLTRCMVQAADEVKV